MSQAKKVYCRAPGDLSANYLAELTLGQKMSLYVPRGVAQLKKDWLLDWPETQWPETQNKFSNSPIFDSIRCLEDIN